MVFEQCEGQGERAALATYNTVIDIVTPLLGEEVDNSLVSFSLAYWTPKHSSQPGGRG